MADKNLYGGDGGGAAARSISWRRWPSSERQEKGDGSFPEKRDRDHNIHNTHVDGGGFLT